VRSFHPNDERPWSPGCTLDCAQAAIKLIKSNKINTLNDVLAEGVGFEPTVPLQARRFSRPVP
jgi:hypothetical protein